jgi:hypothetical protein
MTKKKRPEDLKPKGRPTKYTPELGEEICAAIACSELGLAHILDANPDFPARSTIFMWIRLYPDFKDKYTRAKEDQVEVSVEYMQELMNEPHKYVDEETGLFKLDHNMMRMKMDAIKWQAAKLKPKKFGESKTQEPNNNEVDEDCKKRMKEMDERNKKDF